MTICEQLTTEYRNFARWSDRMQAVGIIVEYNPFHNGHKLHIDMARHITGCRYVIAVMSGNFVQRGEPAIFDKWKRAEMAVKSGVDLVLELPVVFAVRSAQFFAQGGVRLLNSLGLVSHICFGCEHDDIEALKKIAAASENPETLDKLRYYLDNGYTYAAALGKALQTETDYTQEMIASPNNILAIEYLRAIHKFAPGINPVAIKRRFANYHDKVIKTFYASATAIRENLLQNSTVQGKVAYAMPQTTTAIINRLINEKRGPVAFTSFSPIILALLRTFSLEKISSLPDVSEGLQHRIRECALKASDLNEFFQLLKSKRYTRTRLQRIIIHALLGTNRELIFQADRLGPRYARVLAFNDNGREILKNLRNISSVPVINKTTDYLNSKERDNKHLPPLQAFLATDTLASDIYVLGIPNSRLHRGGWDFHQHPVYISSTR